jgi:hypothetical protein
VGFPKIKKICASSSENLPLCAQLGFGVFNFELRDFVEINFLLKKSVEIIDNIFFSSKTDFMLGIN